MTTIVDLQRKLEDQAYDRGYEHGKQDASSIHLGESSYGATQSAIVAVEFTSFLELRNAIRARRHQTYSDNPGGVYMWTCQLIHIHHNDYNKIALLKCGTHYDI